MSRLLLVCRSTSGLKFLDDVAPGTAVVVASDDPRVQAAARSDARVHSVCFLEQPEPFFAVAQDVLHLVNKIDAWLMVAPLPRGLCAETLRWTRNVEGGFTAQRIQDVLLLIRSYRVLLQTSGVLEVRVVAEPHARWMDAVLEACARASQLPFRRHVLRPAGHWWSALLRWLRPCAVAVYYLVNVLRLGGCSLRRRQRAWGLDGAAVFLLGSSLPKHVENVASAMQALLKRGVPVVGVSWAASERYVAKSATVQLAEAGLPAVRLERAITLGNLLASVGLGARMWRRRWRAWWTLPGLSFEGVPLHSLLADSVWHFLVAELPQRIRIERALAVVLGDSRPIALKPWGPEFFEGRTALRLLPKRAETLVFHYWLGASIESPYSDARGMIDLFLAKGPREAETAIASYGLTADQVVLVGHSRFDALLEFVKRTPAAESRQRLGVPLGRRRYVGFDPNGALRGYQSVREQVEMTHAILDAARNNPDLVVVVKPHPAYPIHHLRPVFKAAALANVVIVPDGTSVLDFLNAVDLMVTKYSTLLLEAALIDRIAISVLLDKETRFDLYAGMSTVVFSRKELCDLLASVADEAAFPPWQRAKLARQRAALPDHYYQVDRPAAELSVDLLARQLSRAAEHRLIES